MSDTDNADDLPDLFDDRTDTGTDDSTGAITGPQDEAYDPIELFDHYRHRTNGDETIVILSSFGRGFQALALDVDKAGEILATEAIGDAEDRQSAESMCKYWLKQNPKGILGASADDDDAGGFLDKLGLGGGSA